MNSNARKEKIAAYQAAYRKAHKKETAAYNTAYYEAHKEEIAAYYAAYYEAHKEEITAYQVAYRKTHKGERRAYNQARKEEMAAYYVMRKYNVSRRDAEILIALRDGEGAWCDICHTTNGPFNIDHDHKNGKIRGILCGPCNRRGIDNGVLEAAIEYLALVSPKP